MLPHYLGKKIEFCNDNSVNQIYTLPLHKLNNIQFLLNIQFLTVSVHLSLNITVAETFIGQISSSSFKIVLKRFEGVNQPKCPKTRNYYF